MKSRLATFVLLATACVSSTEPVVPVDAALTSFTLFAGLNPALGADVAGTIAGDTVTLLVPEAIALDSLRPSFTTAEAATLVTLDDAVQFSGQGRVDLTADRTYRLTSTTGDVRDYVVRTVVFTGLPIIRVTTDGGVPIDSRDTYVGADIVVYGGKDHPEWSFSGRTQIRGRGNSTWWNPKKPYRLRLASARSMFGAPADRDWAMLANYWDMTLVRNALAFRISTGLFTPFTPRCAPAELYVNGAHQGSYQVCDHVEVAAHRVPAGADGWFLELNDRSRVEAGEVWFETPRITEYTTVGHGDTIPSVWVFKEPDPPSAGELADIQAQVVAIEDALYGPAFTDSLAGYATLLDAGAIADWFLINELAKNNDAAFSFGVFAYRPVGGKMTFGPVWDFDLAFGNYPWDAAPTGWKIRDAGWMPRLFEDPAFVALVKARWLVLKAQRPLLDAFIAEYTGRLERSQALTHALWAPYNPRPVLRAEALFGGPVRNERGPLPFGPNVEWAAEVQAVRTWLAARFDWLDAQFSAM